MRREAGCALAPCCLYRISSVTLCPLSAPHPLVGLGPEGVPPHTRCSLIICDINYPRAPGVDMISAGNLYAQSDLPPFVYYVDLAQMALGFIKDVGKSTQLSPYRS